MIRHIASTGAGGFLEWHEVGPVAHVDPKELRKLLAQCSKLAAQIEYLKAKQVVEAYERDNPTA